ncbi:hypothetical protein [Rhodococcus opacus]|nr:hypothetical protein [Rhodococcus opacus]MDH6293153.1 hypothetical protein [Rhodococcus opacus]
MAKHRAPRPIRRRRSFSRLVCVARCGLKLWRHREEIQQVFEWIASMSS